MISSLILIPLWAQSQESNVTKNRDGKPKPWKEILGPDKVGLLPEKTLTTGKVIADITAEQICKADFQKDRKPLDEKVKAKVLENYQIFYEKLDKKVDYKKDVLEKGSSAEEIKLGTHYEIDHLVPVLLGGTDDEANLWPQPAQHIVAGASDKNSTLDNALRTELCKLESKKARDFLKQSHDQFMTNWYKLYWERLEAIRISGLK